MSAKSTGTSNKMNGFELLINFFIVSVLMNKGLIFILPNKKIYTKARLL
jgi:hypothetical protein